jgi:hypothetical protein
VALIVPLVVHRLSRRPPDVVLFPSISLLDAAPLRPTQRARLDDRWLLLVRCAMLATVVAGLMQPVWTDRASASNAAKRAASVVVLVDTSSRAAAADGGDGTAPSALVRRVSADHLRSELLAAVAWLRTRPAPRVIELRSDVPAWALDSVDLASLPSDVTLRLVLQPPMEPVRSTRVGAIATGTRLWSSTDAREAWWNALAARLYLRQHLQQSWPPSRLMHAPPVVTNTNSLPMLFNLRGETVVSAQYAPPTLQLVAADAESDIGATADGTTPGYPLREALSPPARAAYTQRHAPVRGAYHAPDQLTRWAALASGPALGPSTSSDVHQQDTLAHCFWAAALMLLALEQWLRSRARS